MCFCPGEECAQACILVIKSPTHKHRSRFGVGAEEGMIPEDNIELLLRFDRLEYITAANIRVHLMETERLSCILYSNWIDIGGNYFPSSTKSSEERDDARARANLKQ